MKVDLANKLFGLQQAVTEEILSHAFSAQNEGNKALVKELLSKAKESNKLARAFLLHIPRD